MGIVIYPLKVHYFKKNSFYAYPHKHLFNFKNRTSYPMGLFDFFKSKKKKAAETTNNTPAAKQFYTLKIDHSFKRNFSFMS